LEDLKKISNSAIVGAGTRQFASSKSSTLELKFGEETAGLVTKAEFTKKRQSLEKRIQLQEHENHEQKNIQRHKIKEEHRKHEREVAKSKLSFLADEDQGIGIYSFSNTARVCNEKDTKKLKKIKVIKNPEVDTSFLSDKEKDKANEKKREKMERGQRIFQEKIENKSLDIIYSFWNGNGLRKKITIKKDDTIGCFLNAVQKQLATDFKKMRSASSGSLMYIIEDIIIPHHCTFHELILKGIRCEHDSLSNLGVRINNRENSDTNSEMKDSHIGKVIEAQWYERNKHLSPPNRWKVYCQTCPRTLGANLLA